MLAVFCSGGSTEKQCHQMAMVYHIEDALCHSIAPCHMPHYGVWEVTLHAVRCTSHELGTKINNSCLAVFCFVLELFNITHILQDSFIILVGSV